MRHLCYLKVCLIVEYLRMSTPGLSYSTLSKVELIFKQQIDLYYLNTLEARCKNETNSLITVVVNFVHSFNATKLVIEKLIDSLNTYYPGLKAMVGVPNTLDVASSFSNIQVTKFDNL